MTCPTSPILRTGFNNMVEHFLIKAGFLAKSSIIKYKVALKTTLLTEESSHDSSEHYEFFLLWLVLKKVWNLYSSAKRTLNN